MAKYYTDEKDRIRKIEEGSDRINSKDVSGIKSPTSTKHQISRDEEFAKSRLIAKTGLKEFDKKGLSDAEADLTFESIKHQLMIKHRSKIKSQSVMLTPGLFEHIFEVGQKMIAHIKVAFEGKDNVEMFGWIETGINIDVDKAKARHLHELRKRLPEKLTIRRFDEVVEKSKAFEGDGAERRAREYALQNAGLMYVQVDGDSGDREYMLHPDRHYNRTGRYEVVVE